MLHTLWWFVGFVTSWEFLIWMVVCYAYFAFLDWTKQFSLTRFLIHYPIRIIVTFITVAFFGLFGLLIYAPIMWVINGFFSIDHGILSGHMDVKRVTNIHAQAYWFTIFITTVLVLTRNFVKTEKEVTTKKQII